MMRHLSDSQLALHSRNDLGFWSRRRAAAHLNRCPECGEAMREFIAAQFALEFEACRLPAGISEAGWRALSREMTANIRVGLEAGECVAGHLAIFRRPRLSLAISACALLLAVAAFQNPPRNARPTVPALAASFDDSAILEGSDSGIAIRGAGRLFSVPAPHDRGVIRTVDAGGDLRSRYIDDSGAVTIVKVYAQ